jgi:hypothetical protein
MSYSDSRPFSIGVQAGTSTGTNPAWLGATPPLFTWIPIGTMSAMGKMDVRHLQAAGIFGVGRAINADGSLVNPNAGRNTDGTYYGDPTLAASVSTGQGNPRIGYAGACLRVADSDFLLFSGGGAKAYGGNDIIGLRLSEDNPQWTVRKASASALPYNASQTRVGLSSRVVTDASNASPIVITLAGTAGLFNLATGNRVRIAGVTGNTAANGDWTMTKIGTATYTTQFSLNGSTGNGAYVSGGTCTALMPSSGAIWMNQYHNIEPNTSSQTTDPSSNVLLDVTTGLASADPTLGPNAAHEYWHVQFHDPTDTFCVFGRGPSWENDSVPADDLGSSHFIGASCWKLNWSTKTWGRLPSMLRAHGGATVDSAWIVKNPATSIFYSAGGTNKLDSIDLSAGTVAWTAQYTDAFTDYDSRGAVYDSTRNLIWMIGKRAGVQSRAFTQPLGPSWVAPTEITLTGPYAPWLDPGTFASPNLTPGIRETNLYWSCGKVYDPINDCIWFYQDDGFLYKITRTDATHYNVDRQPMSPGTLSGSSVAPSALTMSYPVAPQGFDTSNPATGNVMIWNKMIYVPAYKGFVLITDCGLTPTWFVRTAP